MNTETNILHPRVAEALGRYGMTFEVMECDPTLADTAAFLENYDWRADNTANAIVGAAKTEPVKYACCLILANSKLDVNKKLCQLLGVKRASFATGEQTLALTGMEIGGVTPVGVPDDIPIYADAAVMSLPRVLIGGGNRSSKLILDPNELKKVPNLTVVEGLGIPR